MKLGSHEGELKIVTVGGPHRWWYGGTKAQETEQEEARNSTVPPSRWFLVP